jgi:hypothetical protein
MQGRLETARLKRLRPQVGSIPAVPPRTITAMMTNVLKATTTSDFSHGFCM